MDSKPEESLTYQRLLTIREAAEFLSLSVGSLYHMSSEGRVPVVRLSRRCIRFRRLALEQWLADATSFPKNINTN